MIEKICTISNKLSVGIQHNDGSNLLDQFAVAYADQLVAVDHADLLVFDSDHGIQCRWRQPDRPDLQLGIDIEPLVHQYTQFPLAKQPGFNQAIGRKSRHVVDATAGWGQDGFMLMMQGYRVVMVERNPLMALLLTDALQRLAKSDLLNRPGFFLPTLLTGEAQQLVEHALQDVDCVYLDPMFPPKRKKSAIPNKRMQLLQHLLGADDDAAALLQQLIDSGYRRIAVKRPNYANPLVPDPSESFKTKLVHYDVYLSS